MAKRIIRVKRGTTSVNLTGKEAPEWNKDVTRKEALNAWIAGYMEQARKHPSKYRSHGVKRIRFTWGKMKQYRKI